MAVVRAWTSFGSDGPQFTILFLQHLASWESHWITLSVNFHICEMVVSGLYGFNYIHRMLGRKQQLGKRCDCG